jgi:AcrR family transcriptional regulator
MTRGSDSEQSGKPRLGRPPRISREMIVEAALEIGLDGLTLKAVADHLGVSVAGLYHHVSSKDDLMRLTAELSARKVPLPEDRGQHWALWLQEWATYNRDAFLAQPKLLTQYLDGMISTEAISSNVDAILGLLVRQGFTILEASAAYDLVTSCALGTAIGTIREREARAADRSLSDAHKEVLAHADPDALPYFRQLFDQLSTKGRQPFHDQIATVLCGIAIRQGLDWEPIRALLDEARPPKPAPPKRSRRPAGSR